MYAYADPVVHMLKLILRKEKNIMTVMMTMVMLNAAADDDGGHASDDYDNDASRKRHREAGGCFSAAFYILPRVLNSSHPPGQRG